MASYSLTRQALLYGHITTDADRTRIAAKQAEQLKLKAARKVAKEERESLSTTLMRLPIGGRHLMTRYKLTSQVGPLMQRLRVLHGIYFTCRMEIGQGVWAERINPPHAEPASDSPNADLL